MPLGLQAGLWGAFAGGALLLGAATGWYWRIPARITAGIMAFGSGVLISALAFDLMQEALEHGGFLATAGGFLAGAAVYTLANIALERRGAQHRKRSAPPATNAVNGGAIAIGALLDGIPESVAIGLSLLGGHAISLPMVIAIFLSNIPEGLSSAAGMRQSGRRASFVFGMWAGIALLSGLAALAGATLFAGLSPAAQAAASAVAAGGILAMLADTMLPEAFAETRNASGLITALGFLAAFALTKLA